jgi:hypothetical protein
MRRFVNGSEERSCMSIRAVPAILRLFGTCMVCSYGTVAGFCATPITPDSHTIILDHFNLDFSSYRPDLSASDRQGAG